MDTAWLRLVRITATAVEARCAIDGHRAQVEQLRERGRLVWSAAFTNDDGFVEAFLARDRHEAEALAAGSPLVSGGLAAWLLRPLAAAGSDPPTGG
jgi:uncharacterized protein YciI